MGNCYACGAPTKRKGKTLHNGIIRVRCACKHCYPNFEK